MILSNILLIFGSSGGVLKAAVRTAYNMLTGDDLEQLEFKELKEMKGIKESSIEILGKEVKVAVASGLANARRLLESIRDGKAHYEIIEIMACPGGCIGGAGQPLLRGNVSKLEKRMKAIHTEDRDKPIRRSYENKSIKKIYNEYLDAPGSEKAHHLLHTEYSSREKY